MKVSQIDELLMIPLNLTSIMSNMMLCIISIVTSVELRFSFSYLNPSLLLSSQRYDCIC